MSGGGAVFFSIYSTSGLCAALRNMSRIDPAFSMVRPTMLLEAPAAAFVAATNVVTFVSFLAQAAWESGGDAPFSACDENNYRRSPTASCTQRSDGSLYADLGASLYACPRDESMALVATTFAPWATLGPLECTPNTPTQGCCWWARGAIQTTGRSNYGLLQHHVVSKLYHQGQVDLCSNPQAICSGDELLRWVGGIYYWQTIVAAHTSYNAALERYVASVNESTGRFSLGASIVDGADLVDGSGNLVNNGFWGVGAHENTKRKAIFSYLIEAAGASLAGATASFLTSSRNIGLSFMSRRPSSSSPPPLEKAGGACPPAGTIGYCDTGKWPAESEFSRPCIPCASLTDCPSGLQCYGDVWCRPGALCSSGMCAFDCGSAPSPSLLTPPSPPPPPPPSPPPPLLSASCCAEVRALGMIEMFC